MISESLEKSINCWVCGSNRLKIVKQSNIEDELNSSSFAITNSNYGSTAAIYKCLECGFLQCPDLTDVLRFYEDLKDEEYETTREERRLQERQLLHIIRKFKPCGALLDIGAGSGILVDEAEKAGYKAEGLEPSRWLCDAAKRRGLPVHLGTFPYPDISEKFDIITLVDVLEHTSNPVTLLSAIRKALKQGGIGVLVTPDVGSIVARLMGWKWWHFRVAHIGYFSRRTLLLSLSKAGLRAIKILRPVWFFPADYIFDRIKRYLPNFLHLSKPAILKRITIPLNLRDSMLVVFTRKKRK